MVKGYRLPIKAHAMIQMINSIFVLYEHLYPFGLRHYYVS
jgi:hypothetical protein